MRYEYFCDDKHANGCGHSWEEDLSIDDRMIPMNEPCPKCGTEDSICRKFGSHLHHGVINAGAKMDDNFKEQMKRIKTENPDMKTSYF